MHRVPTLLLLLRAALGPVIFLGGWSGWPGEVLFLLLLLAVGSDFFDGVIARRLGVATEWLRRADSLVDTVFYVFVVLLAAVRYPGLFKDYWPGMATIALLEVTRFVFDHAKFKKQAAYHMWSAKLWGLALLLGFSELFLTGQGGIFFTAAIVTGVMTDLEGLTASFVLPEWRHDVPSLFHAFAIRRSRIPPLHVDRSGISPS